jgi:hypothetical protein
MRICAYNECGIPFEPKTHNQRYHDPECCRQATNDRIMDNYYARKARRQGHIRVCASPGCDTQLSRYNDDKICGKCDSAKGTDSRQELIRMLSDARKS